MLLGNIPLCWGLSLAAPHSPHPGQVVLISGVRGAVTKVVREQTTQQGRRRQQITATTQQTAQHTHRYEGEIFCNVIIINSMWFVVLRFWNKFRHKVDDLHPEIYIILMLCNISTKCYTAQIKDLSFRLDISLMGRRKTKSIHYWCTGVTYLSHHLIGPGEIWTQSQISKFRTHFNAKYLKYFLWNCHQVKAKTPHWSLVNIGSGNGLVPSGNKPLPEPMLTKIYVAIWCHKATMS